ncbi:VOC family protein [Acidothermaceae bacterium B102]|nr:VOC family protein [Acidothermaceae bacterium B102]
MAVRITEIIIDSVDPAALAQFWCGVLGYVVTDAEDDVVEIRPAGTDAATSMVPSVLFIKVPEAKTVKNRLHLDVNATVGDRDTELARLLALGATRVDIGQGDVHWYVLADPEGNEFCLLRDRVAAC